MPDDAPLSQAWEEQAANWVGWARKPGHDSYWRFYRAAFFHIVPAPGRLTLDIGCGEGRVARDLKALGHKVIALDVSPTMVRAAAEADPEMDVRVADAARLPLHDGCADLAIAFMSLHDVDDMPGAVREAARVLIPGGAYCIAIVHPINSSGHFESSEPEARFVMDRNYLSTRHYVDRVERDGLTMTFNSLHRPLEAYAQALCDNGFVLEDMREPAIDEGSIALRADRARWRRVPLFLDARARKR